jgi:hypothetical protein
MAGGRGARRLRARSASYRAFSFTSSYGAEKP